MDIRHVLQPLLKIEHHMNLMYTTSLILKDDGKEAIYHILHEPDEVTGKTGLELLEQGTKDADIPFSGGYICHMWHFHHPWTHRGYLSGKSSADVTTELVANAIGYWRAGKKSEALYQLGRTLHLLQDIFVPHHAGLTAVRGHGALENYLLDNWEPYKVTNGGYYEWEESFYDKDRDIWHHVNSNQPYDWIEHGSHISIDWYNKYFDEWTYDSDSFRELTLLIIPNVLRFSAGFINRFFSEAGI
jgi:hypothetical protein